MYKIYELTKDLNLPQRLPPLSGFFILFCFFLLSIHTYIADSEFWTISVAKQLTNSTAYNFSVFQKSVFYLPLSLLYFLPLSDIGHIYAARFLFFLFGLCLLSVFYFFAKKITNSKQWTILALLALLSASVFLNRAFRVRADLIASILNLTYLCLLLNFVLDKFKFRPIFFSFLLFAVNFFMLFTTPKSIIYFLPQLCFALVLVALVKERLRTFFICSIFFPVLSFMFMGFFLFYAIDHPQYFGHYSYYKHLSVAYGHALLFFQNSFQFQSFSFLGSSFFDYLFAESRLLFLKRLLLENPVIVLLNLCFLWRMSWKALFWQRSVEFFCLFALFVYIVCLSLIVFFFNTIVPYFLAAIFPVFALSAVLQLKYFVDFVPEGKKKFFVPLICLFFVFKASYFSYTNIRYNNNHQQLQSIKYIQKYLANFPQANYYDVIAILPRKNQIYAYAGPGQQAANKESLEKVIQERPQLIFYTAKASMLEPWMTNYLNYSYCPIGFGAYARAYKFQFAGLDDWHKQKVDFQARKYFPINATYLLERIEKRFGKDYGRRLYFYTQNFFSLEQAKDAFLIVDRENDVVRTSFTNRIEVARLQSQELDVYVPENVANLAVSIYPPFIDPNNENLLFNFAYDYRF